MVDSVEDRLKLSREQWLRVEPLLGAALEMEAAARAAWLAEIEVSQPDLAPVLRRMVEAHIRAERESALETVPRLAPAPSESSPYAEGERIGA